MQYHLSATHAVFALNSTARTPGAMRSTSILTNTTQTDTASPRQYAQTDLQQHRQDPRGHEQHIHLDGNCRTVEQHCQRPAPGLSRVDWALVWFVITTLMQGLGSRWQ